MSRYGFGLPCPHRDPFETSAYLASTHLLSSQEEEILDDAVADKLMICVYAQLYVNFFFSFFMLSGKSFSDCTPAESRH
jgi:hypothetical protein